MAKEGAISFALPDGTAARLSLLIYSPMTTAMSRLDSAFAI